MSLVIEFSPPEEACLQAAAAREGVPVADINMPELSMSTCPSGSHSTAKIVDGSAAMVRCTSKRSGVMPASCQARHGLP